MAVENNIKKSIVEKSSDLFIKYGINTVRTDDIARYSGISKRTLYIHFNSKALLVKDVIMFQRELIRSQSEQIHIDSTDAVEEFAALWNYISGTLRGSNPILFRDLYRHYPKIWQVLTQFKSAFREDFLVANLKRGIGQGVYRPDIDVELISLLWLKGMGLYFNKVEADSEVRNHFLRGIVSEKGRHTI